MAKNRLFLSKHSTQLANIGKSGFSLIELMVALVIGFVVSLAIYGVLTATEGRKRSTSSINDIDQGGTYALYQLDKYIRSAGSGFTAGIGTQTSASLAYGCALRAANEGSQIFPSSVFPVPFATVSGAVLLAPVIIVDEAAGPGGDIIIAMSGSGGLSEMATALGSPPNSNTLNLKNVAGFRASDIALVVSPPSASMSPCIMEEVSSSFVPAAGNTALPLSGKFYQASIAGTDITSYNTTSVAINLGQNPQFNMFGVGANNTLFRFDLLRNASIDSNPNPGIFVDGVYQMQAIYGVDTDGLASASLNWVAPTGSYSAASLLAGTPAANATLTTIKAIKVALVMRTSLPEKNNVTNPTVKLFNSTDKPITVNLSPLNYRYQAFESTIPLRNTLLIQ